MAHSIEVVQVFQQSREQRYCFDVIYAHANYYSWVKKKYLPGRPIALLVERTIRVNSPRREIVRPAHSTSARYSYESIVINVVNESKNLQTLNLFPFITHCPGHCSIHSTRLCSVRAAKVLCISFEILSFIFFSSSWSHFSTWPRAFNVDIPLANIICSFCSFNLCKMSFNFFHKDIIYSCIYHVRIHCNYFFWIVEFQRVDAVKAFLQMRLDSGRLFGFGQNLK